MNGIKMSGLVWLLLCVPFFGAAQSSDTLRADTVNYFTRGDISKQVFQVETIEVRPDCRCTGVCNCDGTAADDGRSRFSATDEVLEQNGRISLIKRGNFAFEPVLNGMNSDRLNLTIDGMKIFAACTDKMDPVTAYVETNNLESFAVHSGASGGEFGSTIAGSIDMQTNGARLRPNTPISGEVGAGYNSAALGYTALFSLNHSGKRYAVAASGVYRKSNNYRAGGGEIIPFSQFEKWNGSLSGLYLLGDRNLLRADIIVDDAYDIGYPALPMDVAYAKARIYGLTHRHTMREGALKTVETKVYANTVEHVMDDTKRPDVFMHMDMPGWTKTYGAFVKANIRSGNHTAMVKVDGYLSNALAEMTMYPQDDAPMFMLTWPDVDKQSLGIYVEDQWNVSEKDLFKMGARFETLANTVQNQFGVEQATVFNQDLSGTDRRWMPTANLTYQRRLGDAFRAWVTAGYTERAPSVTEQYAFYIFNSYDGYDYIGQVNLDNERSLQGDIGMETTFGKFNVRGTAFYYRMYDYILGITHPEISPMTHGANGVKMFDNIDGANMVGASLQLGYKMESGWQVSTRSSYTHGSDLAGKPLPLIPAFKNDAKLRYDFKHNFVQMEIHSALKQERVDELYGELPTPGYALLNLRGGTFFEWGENRLSLNAGLENVLDKKYTEHLDWGGIPRPGRNIYVNVSFDF